MRRPARVAVFALHAALFAVLAWWTWRKGPDPLVDFGRELYVPWQLTQGKLLSRDIASLFGPLSPYLNALWFRLFGVSLTTLLLSNLAILAAMLAGIHRLVRVSTDRLTAAIATIGVMVLFGFSQYVPIGNYNFVAPYSHEATHGLALGVAMVLAFHKAYAARRDVLFAVVGLCFGGIVLTKPETAAAAAIAVIAGFIAVGMARRREGRPGIGALAAFAAGTSVLPTAFFAFFRLHLPADAALRAVFAAYEAAAAPGMVKNLFYRHVTGLDAPFVNSLRMVCMFAAFVAYAGAGILIARRAAAADRWRTAWRIAAIAVPAVVVSFAAFSSFATALPLIALSMFGIMTAVFLRRARDGTASTDVLPMLMWSAFSVALLAKMGLKARLVYYGFFLALPAVTVAVVLLVWLIPRSLRGRTTGASEHFRTFAMASIAFLLAPYLLLSYGAYSLRTVPIGSGGDRFYASSAPEQWQGPAVREALEQIPRFSSPGAPFAVLPEGIMLNYLLRRESPLHVINLMPPELLVFGEAGVLRSLQAAPPELIVLVHRDVSEYGYPPFGSDPRYGQSIVSWVRAHYRPVSTIGVSAGDEAAGGIEILARTVRDR